MKEIIQNLGVTDIHPIRKGTDGSSKFGSKAFYGQFKSNRVKVTVYPSRDPINIQKHISYNNLLTDCLFPKIIKDKDNVLVEEWISGKTIKKFTNEQQIKYSHSVFKFMQQCKQVDITDFPNSLDYLAFLEARIEQYNYDDVQSFLNEWRKQRALIHIDPFLGHNDLSNNNIIVQEQTGKLYIVDHELFGVSSGWFLMWKNSFLSRLNNHASPPGLYDSIPNHFIEMTWKLRKIGSYLRSDRHTKAMKLCKN